MGCIPDVGWRAPLLPLLLSWNRSFGWEEQECYNLSAACGSTGIANVEINRGGVKNHVGRHAIARAMKDHISQTKQGKARVSGWKGSCFFLALDLLDATDATFSTSTKMLLVWARPGVFSEMLGVDLSCLGLFTVRMFISPPSDGMLLRFYLSAVLSGGQALLSGGMRAKGLRHWGHRVFFRQEALKEKAIGNSGDVTEGCKSQNNSHCFLSVWELL